MKRIAAVTLVFLLFFTGCVSTGQNSETLLKPPKQTEEQNEIYKALEEAVGSNITLRYPISGDHRSAFVIRDLDDEPTNEALVFYQQNLNIKDAPLRINVIDQIDGVWKSVADVSTSATGIDKVYFKNFRVDGPTDVVIGFNYIKNTEHKAVVYNYVDRMLTPKAEYSYLNLEVFDLDLDGLDEMLLINRIPQLNEVDNAPASGAANGTTLRMLGDEGEGLVVQSEVMLNPSAESFPSIRTNGYISSAKRALFIDENIGGGYLGTEVVYLENGKLINPFNKPVYRSLYKKSQRRSAVYCHDINQDTIVEIPVMRLFPGYTDEESPEAMWMIEWYQYGEEETQKVSTIFLNANWGFSFELPEEWIGKVSVKRTLTDNEYSFVEYDESRPFEQNDTEIFRMRVVTTTDERTRDELASYQKLKLSSTALYDYYVYIPDSYDGAFQVDYKTLQQMFDVWRD